MASIPMPGHWKIVSVMTAPLSSSGRLSPTTVISGMSALRKACRMRTTRSPSPFARAVVT